MLRCAQDDRGVGGGLRGMVGGRRAVVLGFGGLDWLAGMGILRGGGCEGMAVVCYTLIAMGGVSVHLTVDGWRGCDGADE